MRLTLYNKATIEEVLASVKCYLSSRTSEITVTNLDSIQLGSYVELGRVPSEGNIMEFRSIGSLSEFNQSMDTIIFMSSSNRLGFVELDNPIIPSSSVNLVLRIDYITKYKELDITVADYLVPADLSKFKVSGSESNYEYDDYVPEDLLAEGNDFLPENVSIQSLGLLSHGINTDILSSVRICKEVFDSLKVDNPNSFNFKLIRVVYHSDKVPDVYWMYSQSYEITHYYKNTTRILSHHIYNGTMIGGKYVDISGVIYDFTDKHAVLFDEDHWVIVDLETLKSRSLSTDYMITILDEDITITNINPNSGMIYNKKLVKVLNNSYPAHSSINFVPMAQFNDEFIVLRDVIYSDGVFKGKLSFIKGNTMETYNEVITIDPSPIRTNIQSFQFISRDFMLVNKPDPIIRLGKYLGPIDCKLLIKYSINDHEEGLGNLRVFGLLGSLITYSDSTLNRY